MPSDQPSDQSSGQSSDQSSDADSLDDLLDSTDGVPSDAELITAVRAGDEHAFGQLWQRHEAAALRLARQITNPSNAEDLVSESFARLLRVLRQGGGPDGAFRPYLFSTLRRLNIDQARSYSQRITLTDDDSDLEAEPASSAADVAASNAENSAAWRAWASLPESSRTLLWHLVVEEETPAQIAPLVGTSANGVSSRAVRARERLRQAFLQQHVADAVDEKCRWTRSRMGEYVRDALSARDRAAVQAHLDECDTCPAVLFEITDVNQTLRVVIAPIILGGVAVGAYTGAAGGLIGGSHAASAGPLKFIGGRARATATRGVLLGVAAAVVLGGIATAATIAATTSSHSDAKAASPIASSSAPSPSAPNPPAAVATATSSAPVAPSDASTGPAVPAVPTTTPSTRPTARATKPTTPTRVVSVVVPVIPVIPSTPSVVITTPTVPAPPALTTITAQPHQGVWQTPDGTDGTATLTLPAGWTVTAVNTSAAGMTCQLASASEADCTVAGSSVQPNVPYVYTVDLTGPAADHASTMTIVYAGAGDATPQQITPVINP